MVLTELLDEIESSSGMVNPDDLSRKLGVQRSALEGMIAFWVRKGRLTEGYAAAVLGNCDTTSCAVSCPGTQSCPQLRELPRTYSFVPYGEPSTD